MNLSGYSGLWFGTWLDYFFHMFNLPRMMIDGDLPSGHQLHGLLDNPPYIIVR